MLKSPFSGKSIVMIAILLGTFFICACEEKKTTLVIKAPMQEMNILSNPNIHDVPTFLNQAAQDFIRSEQNRDIMPVVRAFNYVDEIRAVADTFDTPDSPDILFGAFFNLSGYVDTGRVIPLDDLANGKLKEDLEDLGVQLGSRKGKLYLLPFLSMQNILFYNKKLFQECGLEKFIGKGREIQNWSLPEWKYILDTLAQKLPGGKYPLAIFAANNQGDTHIMSYLRAFGGSIFDKGGNFDFQEPRIIKSLAWLQEGVRRGCFPPHPENLEMKDCSELFANGQLAIYMFNNANRALYSHIDDYGFVNYPGNIATAFHNGFIVFDNGNPEKIAAAKKFLEFIFEKDEWRDLSAGNIPASKRTLAKYRDKITMFEEFDKNSINVINFMNDSPNWQGAENSVRSVFWPNINKLLRLTITPEQCAANLDKVCNAALEAGRKTRKLHP